MYSIDLPYSLGVQLRNILTKTFKGRTDAPAKVVNAYNYNETFSDAEMEWLFENVHSLSIDDPNQIKFLKGFKKLNSLSVRNAHFSDSDVDEIAKLGNLEFLNMDNVSGLQTFDVDKFPKLHTLSLTHCPDLKRIANLTPQIETFTCYSNFALQNIHEITRQTLAAVYDRACNYKLDAIYAPKLFENMKTYPQFKTFEQDLPLCVSFADEISSSFCINNTFNQMKDLQERIEDVSKKILSKGDSDQDKFVKIYGWICRNIKYDSEASSDKKHRQNSEEFELEGHKVMLAGREFGANDCLSAIKSGKCVCEGFSKILQYFCLVNGIKTNLVTCYANGGAHSIIQYEDTKNQAFYCDITWDAQNWQRGDRSLKWFMLSKEDMGKDHTKIVSNKPLGNGMTIDAQTKQQSIAQNLNQ